MGFSSVISSNVFFLFFPLFITGYRSCMIVQKKLIMVLIDMRIY